MNRLLIRSDHLSIGPMNIQNLSPSALRRRRRNLVRDLPPLEKVLRGSLTETYKRCGRPNCHCTDGPGHGPKRYLVISQPGGRPRRDYVPNAVCEQVVHLIDNFHRLREALNEICAINAELLRRRKDLG
jgi:hypothetical protein